MNNTCLLSKWDSYTANLTTCQNYVFKIRITQIFSCVKESKLLLI